MNTQICSSKTLGFGSGRSVLLTWLLAFLFCGLVEGRATVTPYVVDASSFNSYAVLADLSHGGSFNVNGAFVNGNTGVIGSSANGANNDVLNGNLSYSQGSFGLNSTVSVTGSKTQSFTLANSVQAAADFSHTIAGFTPTLTLGGDLNGNTTISRTAGLNVVDITGVNVNGTITVNGGANDIFYVNVGSNFNVQGITLAGGVKASNVFWNLANGQSSNLSGNLSGNFLSFNGSGQAAQLNINNATVNGELVAGSFNMNDINVTALPPVAGAGGGSVMAPEASSNAALGAFGLFLLGSSLVRSWKNKVQVASIA